MITPRTAAFLSLVAVCLCSPSALQGQQPERENVRISGVVSDLGPGILQITDNANQTWLVKIENDRTEVSYTAVAMSDWIRPGMWLQLRANLNQRLQSDAPVGDLTVFTPKPDMQLGIVPEVSLGQGLFSPEQPDPKAEKDKSVPCMVRGRLVGIKKNKLTINAGQAVTVEVPDDVKIAVELADYRLAKAGDKVEISGWKYAMIPGRAVALQLSIAAQEPLTTVAAKRRGNKDEKDEKDEKDQKDPTDGKESGANQ